MQPNFGHHHAHGFGTFIDSWGDGPLLIRDGSREWFFEFSEMFGPLRLRKSDMQPADNQFWKEDDPFWNCFAAWIDGGKKCRAVRTKRGKLRFWVCHWKREPILRAKMAEGE